MRAVVQRVSNARVDIDGATAGSIGRGLLILLGVGHDDSEEQAERLWSKIARLRIFEDAEGKTNLSLADVGGEVLVVDKDHEDFVSNPAVLEKICARLDAIKAKKR